MRIALLLIILYTHSFCFSQDIVWAGNNQSVDIAEALWVLEDSAKKLTIEQVSSPAMADKYAKKGQKILDFGQSTSVYWLKFDIKNTSDESLVLAIAQPLVQSIDMYYRDTAGKWQVIPAGYKININDKIIKDYNQLFPLPAGGSEVFLRLQANLFPIPVRIQNAEYMQVHGSRQKIFNGIYMGIMLFVILYNLFLFFSLRRITYLHYSILVFMYAAFAALLEGYILDIFPNINYFRLYALNPIVNQRNGLLYCILFLEVKKYLPRKMYVFSMAVFAYFVSFIFWHPYLDQKIVLGLSQVHALIGVLLMSTIGIMTGRRGNKLGYYFALAYFIFFGFCILEIAYLRSGTPGYIFGISHVSMGIFIEVFILAYLLSKRFEWEKAEIEAAKAEAQRQLLEQTQENERIVREQNTILEQRVKERTYELNEEKEKSEKLLLNILPAEVAEELKESGHANAKQFNNVTVLFSDFVGFSTISENLSPTALVAEIDTCFKAFDDIMERNGLEKIKTIGDAYLAVCGMPEEDNKHAIKCITAALEIREFMTRYRAQGGIFETRIGLHSGPVVAGIVGVKKFAYDIWGDTVNTAARMEQNSEPGKINISGDTFELTKDHFVCEHRGKLPAKNKGDIDMYFVSAFATSAASAQ